MGRVIVISSGKGGVGKTTITANLGIVLARANKSVCLVDADFGLNNLDVALGVENRVVYDVMDVLKGSCRLSQALIKDPIYGNLYTLASIKQDSTKLISIPDFRGVILDLAEVFDYVLIDSPAGIDYGFERAIAPAGEMLIIVTPSIPSIRDARKTMDKAKSLGILQCRVVVNRAIMNLIKKGEMLSHRDIEALLGEKVVGVIPESIPLCLGSNLKMIFASNPEILHSFEELKRNVENNASEIKSKGRLNIKYEKGYL